MIPQCSLAQEPGMMTGQQIPMVPGLMPMQHISTPFYPGLTQPGSVSQGAYMSPTYIQDNGFIPGGCTWFRI